VLCGPPVMAEVICPGGAKPAALPDGVCGDLQLLVDFLAGRVGTP